MSLPIVVVLPAPLTPATMITVGLAVPSAPPITSGFCSGASRSVMASASSPFTAAGSVALASFTRRFRSASKWAVAPTPASAISSADSRSSYSASSMRVPVKTVAMLLPVLRRPCLRRSNQPARAASAGTGAGASAGAAGAAATGVAGGFFLKKLNIGRARRAAYIMRGSGALAQLVRATES